MLDHVHLAKDGFDAGIAFTREQANDDLPAVPTGWTIELETCRDRGCVPIYASETYVNATRGHIIGEDEPQETRYTFAELGKLFRFCQREFGGCKSSVYVDAPGGRAHRIGWVFERTERYEDTNEPYLREVWVTLHTQPPTVTRQNHYARIA